MFGRNAEGTIELVGARHHQFGEDVLPQYLQEFKPDILWTLCDLFMIPFMMNFDFGPTKWCMYFPSDGEHLVETHEKLGVKLLKKCDIPVAMSKYAQNQALKEGIENCRHINHGIDTKNFYPQDKLKSKEWLSERMGQDLTSKFIVGTVSRFQGRKSVPEMLKVWKEFSEGKDDVFLLLKMDVTDPAGGPGINLFNLMKRYKIEDSVGFFKGYGLHKGLTENDMGKLYNSFDTHILTTSGEGFGIPIIEAMSCGVPNIITDVTTTEELLGDNERGLKVPLSTSITGTFQVERGFVDKDKFSEQLNVFYSDKTLQKKLAKNSYLYAQKNFDFENTIFPKWKKLFEEELE